MVWQTWDPSNDMSYAPGMEPAGRAGYWDMALGGVRTVGLGNFILGAYGTSQGGMSVNMNPLTLKSIAARAGGHNEALGMSTIAAPFTYADVAGRGGFSLDVANTTAASLALMQQIAENTAALERDNRPYTIVNIAGISVIGSLDEASTQAMSNMVTAEVAAALERQQGH